MPKFIYFNESYINPEKIEFFCRADDDVNLHLSPNLYTVEVCFYASTLRERFASTEERDARFEELKKLLGVE